MFKDVANQYIFIYAHNDITNAPKTGDAANITATLSKDAGGATATNDTNPTEMHPASAPGIYRFSMLQAEANADVMMLVPLSSTAGITIAPIVIYTKLTAATINAEVDTALNTAIPGSPTANSINQRVAAVDDLTQASGNGDLAAMKVDLDAMATGGSAPSLE